MNRYICCKAVIPDGQLVCLNCIEQDNDYEEREEMYEQSIKKERR